MDGFAILEVLLTGLGEGVGAGAARRKYKNCNSKISGEPHPFQSIFRLLSLCIFSLRLFLLLSKDCESKL